jgi:hypothetical protein
MISQDCVSLSLKKVKLTAKHSVIIELYQNPHAFRIVLVNKV